jgi:phage terminase small subunit
MAPKAPAHLRPATQRWFTEMAATYALESQGVQLLTLAAEARDRAEQARARIVKDGAYVQGRYGLRAHPAIAVERDSRLAFARLVRELQLEDQQAPEAPRPPAIAGRYK